MVNTSGLLDGYPNMVIDRTPGIEPHRARKRRFPMLFRLLKKLNPRAVLTNDDGRSGICRDALSACTRLGIRKVLRSTPYDLVVRSLPAEISRLLFLRARYRKFDGFCAVGTLPQLHFERFSGKPNQVYASPYCTDDFVLQRMVDDRDKLRQDFRRHHGISDDEKLIVSVSRFITLKNVAWLIGQFDRVSKAANVRLCLVGDGPLWNEVEQAAEPLGDRVTLLGAQPRSGVGEALASADAFALASSYEAWGVVVNEAIFFRLPCLVSNKVASAYDLIHEGETGFVFRDRDPLSFQQSFSKLMTLVDQGASSAPFDRLTRRFSPFHAAAGILQASKCVP